MAHVVLFHSAQGLRPAVLRFADALREAGHEVTTPDLFEGAVFDRVEDGAAHRDAIGIPTLLKRANAAVEGLKSELVYAGFSMGAAPAQVLALTRPRARGVILMHGALPLEMIGVERWPEGLPGQLHFAEKDPWIDVAAADALAAAGVEVFRYPGKRHLFADEDSPDYEPEHAAQMLARVRTFLERC